jgi:hypothetical protein
MKVKIFHKAVDVEFKKDPKLGDGSKSYGFFDEDDGRIVAAANIKPDDQREVVMHELFHVIDDTLGIGLPEKKLRPLSVGVFTMLKENPELCNYFFGKIKE